MKKRILLSMFTALLLILILLPFNSAEESKEEQFDSIKITKDLEINGSAYNFTSNITVTPGTHLSIFDSEVYFESDEDTGLIYLTIEKGGKLTIQDSTVQTSRSDLGLIILCKGEVHISSSHITNLGALYNIGEEFGGIVISSDTVSITETTVEYSHIGITLDNSKDVVIKDCVINNSYMGVYSKDSKAELIDNTFINCLNGIYDVSSSNTYLKNDLSNCFQGFYLTGSSSIIDNNDIQDCDKGVMCESSLAVTIKNNYFDSNEMAIHTTNSNLTIKNNEIKNGWDGMFIDNSGADISNNIIYGQQADVSTTVDCSGCSRVESTGLGSGVHLFNSIVSMDKNEIYDSNIGVICEFTDLKAQDNVIHNMSDGGVAGPSAYLSGFGISTSAGSYLFGIGFVIKGILNDQVVLKNNIIKDNLNDAIFLNNADVMANMNTINRNGGYGIHNIEGNIDVDFENSFLLNQANYAYSKYATWYTQDIYGNYAQNVDVTVTSMNKNISISNDTSYLSKFSVILLSFSSDEVHPLTYIPESYEVVFQKEGVLANSSFDLDIIGTSVFNVTMNMFRPDLHMIDLQIESGAAQGKKSKITAKVQNIGDTSSSQSQVRFYWVSDDSSRVIADVVVPVLEKGEITMIKASWKPNEPGKYLVTAQLDPDNDIKEVVEENNEFTTDVKVRQSTDYLSYVIIGLIVLLFIALILVLFSKKKVRKKRKRS